MKMVLVILIGCLASLYAQSPTAQGTEQNILPYDRLARNNIALATQPGAGGFSTDTRKFSKTVDLLLSPIGSNSDPATVELYVVMKRDGFVPFARLVEIQEAQVGSGKIKFVCDETKIRYRGDDIKGWLVRAVRGGRVVGFVASSTQYEEIATNPSLLSGMLAQKWQRK
ncbi:MAG TPA: hypothetical protein VIS96_07190 [Terrimicrobiaceae bacterium]